MLLVILNLIVKPFWIFAIDRQVQNITGFTSYGRYFAILNLAIIFNFLLDLGISTYFNREIASGRSKGNQLFTEVLIGKIWLSLFYAIIVSLVAYITGIRDYGLLWLMIILQAGHSMLLFLRANLTASQLFRQDAILSVIDKLLVIILAGTVLLFPGIIGPITINLFLWIQIAAISFSALLGIYFLSGFSGNFSFPLFSGFRKDIILSGLPFAFNVFLMTVILRSDGFLLERIHPNGAAEAGVYAAGFRLLDAFNMVGFLVAGFLLPYIARQWPDLSRFEPVLLASRHMLLLGGILAIAFTWAAPELITRLLYYRDDAYTTSIIKIIMLAVPALSIIHIYGTTLTATRNMQSFIRLSLLFSVLALLFNFLMIPRYGAIASAIIAAGLQSSLCCFYYVYCQERNRDRSFFTFFPSLPGSRVAIFCNYAYDDLAEWAGYSHRSFCSCRDRDTFFLFFRLFFSSTQKAPVGKMR